MIAAARRTASPYARRLARERGIGLAGLAGSGPGGRIVAADIETLAQRPAAAPAPAAVGATASAFAATLDLQALNALLADFGKAQVSLSLDAMLLRAAALALEAVPAARPAAGPIAITWETGGGDKRGAIGFDDAHQGLVSGIESKLNAAEPPAGGTAALSLRRIGQAGIRPSAMPLLRDVAMRLVVTAAAGDGAAEALLCFDASSIGEDDAAALLARFRDSLKNPLRLLA